MRAIIDRPYEIYGNTILYKSRQPFGPATLPKGGGLFFYASFILCFTTLVSLAINSPLVGFPFWGLTVLPK